MLLVFLSPQKFILAQLGVPCTVSYYFFLVLHVVASILVAGYVPHASTLYNGPMIR